MDSEDNIDGRTPSEKDSDSNSDMEQTAEEAGDLYASSIESDVDESEESDDDDQSQINDQPASKADKIKGKILNKYQEIKGKQLYVRFPIKLPLEEAEFQQKVKELSPLIVKGHKPRQKHARFCLVDFQSKDDRDKSLNKIKKLAQTDDRFKGIFVAIPKTESEDFVNELVERNQTSLENKKAKARLRRASKQALRDKNFTSSIVVTNVPKTSSIAEIRTLFSNAVDIQIKPGKGKRKDTSIATVTLPTTIDARAAVNKKHSLHGTQLIIHFNSHQKKRKLKRGRGVSSNLNKVKSKSA